MKTLIKTILLLITLTAIHSAHADDSTWAEYAVKYEAENPPSLMDYDELCQWQGSCDDEENESEGQ